MKRSWIILLFLFLFSTLAFADYWAKTYGGPFWDSATSIQQTSDGGFIIAGWSESFGGFGNSDIWLLKLDQHGNIMWQKRYGGEGQDRAYSIQETSDKGFIVAGYTESFGTNNREIWILKLNSNGDIIWQKKYGLSTWYSTWYCAYSIQQTSDGGFIVAGVSEIYSLYAFLVFKLDKNGNILWQKRFRWEVPSTAYSIQQTSDGGFIIAGYTYLRNSNDRNFWIIKLDSVGNPVWQKIYGGNGWDEAYYIQQTSDEGFIVAGGTYSFGAGNMDIWILRLNSNGDIIWQKTYGGREYDVASIVKETLDRGFIVAGRTRSFGEGYMNILIFKIDKKGNIIWQKIYGGSGDWANSLIQTSEGDFVVAGGTSFGYGMSDIWVLKLNKNGSIPGCNYEKNSNIKVTNTSIIPNNTNTYIEYPNISGDNTSIKPVDTNASVSQICYYKQITKNVPTLNEWGIIILTILSGLFGIFYLRRKEI